MALHRARPARARRIAGAAALAAAGLAGVLVPPPAAGTTGSAGSTGATGTASAAAPAAVTADVATPTVTGPVEGTPEPELATLYRNRHDYVRRVGLSGLFSALRGFVPPEDVTAIVEAARTAELPGVPER